MKKLIQAVFAVSFLFATTANATVILSLDPADQTANTGDEVTINLTVDGLGNYNPVSLGSFIVDLVFDNDILTFSDYTMTNLLGEVGVDADDWSVLWAPYYLRLDLFSYLSTSDLWALQPESFVLAELKFTVNQNISNLTSLIDFAYADLYRASGQQITDIEFNNATVNVPTPATLLLLSLGLVAVFSKRKALALKA